MKVILDSLLRDKKKSSNVESWQFQRRWKSEKQNWKQWQKSSKTWNLVFWKNENFHRLIRKLRQKTVKHLSL